MPFFKRLSANNFLILFFTALVSTLAIVALWLTDTYIESKHELSHLKENYIQSQKKILKDEVHRTVKIIRYRKNLEEKRDKIDTKIVQHEILNRNRKIRFDEDGYIFIYADDGTCIMHPIKPQLEGKNLINLKDANGKLVIAELIKASKRERNKFVKYLWHQPSTGKVVEKLGYAEHIDGWNWMVGSGIYINSINKVIKQKQRELKQKMQEKIVDIIGLFFLILMFMSYFLYKQYLKTNNSFKQFHNVLNRSHNEMKPIDLGKIDFIEFQELARDFNIMVDIVKNNINDLDKIIQEKTQEVQEQKDIYENLYQKSTDGILLIENGKFINCNESIVKMLQYSSKDELLNIHPSKLSPQYQPDGRESFKKANEMMQIALNTGSHAFEWMHTRATGENFWAEIVLTKITQNNKDILHVVWRDIDARKEAEHQLEQLTKTLQQKVDEEVKKSRQKDQAMLQQTKLAQMGEMISMIAHQWRQPLTAISAISNDLTMKIMLNKYDKNYFNQKLKNLANLSQHLSKTIDDFRSFHKKDKQKTEILYSNVVNNALNIVSVSIKNKNIELITDFNCHKRVNTYPNELQQVILNLIKNAEDILLENKTEKPYIHIKTYDDDSYSYLEVSDNGGGIKEDIMDKIFEPYFSTKTKKDGTGLGLYMSKTIIEEHCGGKLSVSNSEDGAVFRIVSDLTH